MKLRLTSIASKETLKIETLDSCSLRELKQILSRNLPNSPSPDSISLSLNRKDELQSASPDSEDSLRLLGISFGDLIFFSLAADSMHDSSAVSVPYEGISSNSVNVSPAESSFITSKVDYTNSETALNSSAQNRLSGDHDFESDSLKRKTLDTGNQFGEILDCVEISGDGDGCNNDDVYSAEVVENSLSVPGFLRKVFVEELGDDSGGDHKSTVVAIHAVLLESGFVGFDPNSYVQVNGFQYRNEWPSNGIMSSIFYTLPEIVDGARGDVIDSVVLKFQSLGKFLFVYGSLGNELGNGIHFVKLNEDLLVPLLNVVWANCGVTESIYRNDGGMLSTTPEKELFRFWRNAKDNLALPLLIDLCEKAGLELPPCFIRLPTDLKLKILELLPGVDVAKVSCVCSELHYLASSDELWMMKFKEKFGNERIKVHGKWKSAFVMAWEKQKNGRLESSIRTSPGWYAPGRMRHRNPFVIPRAPRIIGGNHDIWPESIGDSRPRLHGPVNLQMLNFSPRCNLGRTSSRNFV